MRAAQKDDPFRQPRGFFCCGMLTLIALFVLCATRIASAKDPAGKPNTAAVPLTTSATVAEAVIQNNKTAIQLSRGTLHLYGLAIGGPGTSTLFSDGQYASVFHEAGLLGAALAYGKNSQVRFTTKTNNHAIGGVSIGGSWDTFHAFYGSNATKGASSAAANFTVSENSLVVVIGLAASQQSLKLVGIPALQIDASNSGAAADGAMVLAHTYLGPGKYTLTEQSSGRPGVMDDDYRADLVGIFVFGSKP